MHVAVGAVVLLVAGVPAGGQPTIGEVRGWFESEMERAAAFDPDEFVRGNVEMRYVVEFHEVPEAEEIARMRREVEGRPDHPDRLKLEVYERRLAEGAETPEYVLFFGSKDRWRWSVTGSNGSWYDNCFRNGTAWILSSGGTLSIFDREDGFPEQHDLNSELDTIRTYLSRHVVPGLWDLPLTKFHVDAVGYQGKKWKVFLRSPEFDVRLEFAVEWDENRGSGAIVRREVVKAPSMAEAVGRAETYSGRVAWAGASFPVVREIQSWEPDGDLSEVSRIESVAPLGDERLEAVLRTPRPGETDPVRGEVAILKTNDWRSGGLVVTTHSAEGERRQVVRMEPAEAGAGGRTKLVALEGAALVVVVIGWIWWSRRGS